MPGVESLDYKNNLDNWHGYALSSRDVFVQYIRHNDKVIPILFYQLGLPFFITPD